MFTLCWRSVTMYDWVRVSGVVWLAFSCTDTNTGCSRLSRARSVTLLVSKNCCAAFRKNTRVGVLPHSHRQNMISSLWSYCTWVSVYCICCIAAVLYGWCGTVYCHLYIMLVCVIYITSSATFRVVTSPLSHTKLWNICWENLRVPIFLFNTPGQGCGTGIGKFMVADPDPDPDPNAYPDPDPVPNLGCWWSKT